MKLTLYQRLWPHHQTTVVPIGSQAKSSKNEDLVALNVFNAPNETDSTKVKFTFKILEGNQEWTPEVFAVAHMPCHALQKTQFGWTYVLGSWNE